MATGDRREARGASNKRRALIVAIVIVGALVVSGGFYLRGLLRDARVHTISGAGVHALVAPTPLPWKRSEFEIHVGVGITSRLVNDNGCLRIGRAPGATVGVVWPQGATIENDGGDFVLRWTGDTFREGDEIQGGGTVLRATPKSVASLRCGDTAKVTILSEL